MTRTGEAVMRRHESIHGFTTAAEELMKEADQEQRVCVCTGGGCIASGSLELKEAFIAQIREHSLSTPIIGTGCMGPCSKGPVVKILPEDHL